MIQIMKTWESELKSEKSGSYYLNLMKFLDTERKKKKVIYPPQGEIFNALKLTPLKEVRVVILGQDPYHGPGQAHGLAFSVRKGVRVPPSLQNIFKELKADLDIDPPDHGNLEAWARNGVLLLNNVLTVEEGRPGSHHGQGWETFTDKIIEVLNTEKENLVFMLWGAPARKKAKVVNPDKHLMLTSVHPSPLSCYRGFIGSKPFSKANNFLVSKGLAEINWAAVREE